MAALEQLDSSGLHEGVRGSGEGVRGGAATGARQVLVSQWAEFLEVCMAEIVCPEVCMAEIVWCISNEFASYCSVPRVQLQES